MFLPSLNINVSSYEDLFWQLDHLPKASGPTAEPTKPPQVIPVPDIATQSLFALVIGIDNYANPDDAHPLKGAVKDATDMRNYLLTNLKVPDSQIRFLTNDQARRIDITQAFGSIQTDKRIKKDDPILIFYAGHGYETNAPENWPSGDVDKQIQMIVPYDYSTDPDRQVHGIPDVTLASSLTGIANEHGNNITVIFDCCHSGSGTRDLSPGVRVRGLDEEKIKKIPSNLDHDIWSTINGARGSATAPPYTRRGLKNHVLLAACTQKEKAKESERGGHFTQALLQILTSEGADKLTYISLINRMDKLDSQNPQCEGAHELRERIIFDSKAPQTGRVCFAIEMNEKEYEMQAGRAHGITEGAEFSLYDDILTIDVSPPRGVFVASAGAIRQFTTNLQIKQPSEPTSPHPAPPTLSETSCVLQTKAGKAEELVVFAPLDDNLTELYKELAKMMKNPGPGERQIRLVLEPKEARLGLSIVNDMIQFNILEPRLAEYYKGWRSTSMPYTVGNNPHDIIRVLQGAAHFYWHLNREEKNLFLDTNITIKCHAVVPSGQQDELQGYDIFMPTGEDLLKSGVLDILASKRTEYGYTIINNGDCELYVNAFYFNNNDFSIVPYIEPPAGGKGKAYPPISPNGGCLPIGYGSGGVESFRYDLQAGIDINVGYLVFFFSSKGIVLSGVPQPSQFDLPGRDSDTDLDKVEHPKVIYGTRLVPIIRRRYPAQKA